MIFRLLLVVLLIDLLYGCGGGGGGGGGMAILPVASAPAASEPAPPAIEPLQLNPVNPGCVQAADNHVECPLIANSEPIGVGVPAGTYVKFTNNTASMLQIDGVQAATGEVQFWNEHCVYLGELITGQHKPGIGEVGCSAKQPNENYAPILWGQGTGLSIAPGQVVYVNSNQTSAGYMNTTYALRVREQVSGLHAWRQPQHDAVIPCNDQQQSTQPSPILNDTGRTLHLTGAGIYSENGMGGNTMIGGACIYVMTNSGAEKYRNCDDALRTRGNVSFPTITIEPGEYLSAQASNACRTGGVWDWAAFLRVW